jgi:hypothetical protein
MMQYDTLIYDVKIKLELKVTNKKRAAISTTKSIFILVEQKSHSRTTLHRTFSYSFILFVNVQLFFKTLFFPFKLFLNHSSEK